MRSPIALALWCACCVWSAAWAQSSAPANNDMIEAGVAAMERGHYATAYRAWIKAAEAGDAMAQTNIGYLYERGWGQRQSYVKALAWYRRAADQGLPQAEFNIGTLYYYGFGVERNPREAVGWFRRAAREDLAQAQYMLGMAY
ncbi:MAG: tetratricopeptide repeat protein [Burkholderiaceae bacterium]